MGKRARRRSTGATGQRASGSEPTLPTTTYADTDAGELELRSSLTVKARQRYAATLAGGREREDAWQRATELLFEQLAVAWTIAGVRADRQKELLGRYRVASAAERRFVRDSLRAHLAEH
ncbi:MAG: hypothetical protein KGL16_09700, partial [Acidobacteriota bacterium]|nr:hypothetical protein [Acidobacteriota bacterium]